MRILAGVVLAAAGLAGGGCLAVATVAAVGAVATTTVKTTGKVAGATIKATGRVASAVISSPKAPVALTVESAAALARPDRVVVVENGAVTDLPWQQGMTLATVVPAGKPDRFSAANVFRGRSVLPAWTGELALRPGDVVELRR
ncbi:MAG: hypothetical protein HYV75_02205 [Opitutae bacterium]|nr:hypothetical protein [Opitutae bacterium]